MNGVGITGSYQLFISYNETAVIIDRNSPIPLHEQLTTLIKSQITDGLYAVGASLPSEREMCDQYGVSRTTVRETMRQLEREGLIQKIAGRGIFLTEPKRELAIKVSLSGYSSDIRREGGVPASRLLDAGLISQPGLDLRKSMKLVDGDEVVRIMRLRFNNNIPLALHTVYLNHQYCPQILDHNLSHDSLFNLLSKTYGLKLNKAEEHIYAGLANQNELKLLSLSYPSAVLRSERMTYLDTGEVIEYSQATYCGESYRIVVNLDAQE
jgi:GntR family transcriptional regulator